MSKSEKPGETAGKDARIVDFESALDQLEKLVSSMEEGDLSLEESLQAFEKGVKLTRDCQSALQQAEQKVQILLDDNGNTEPLDFDADDDRD